jgi:hypothetical protein
MAVPQQCNEMIDDEPTHDFNRTGEACSLGK